MVEFLENPVKLQNEGSQTFVQLIAPACAEEGSRLEEGYQRRTGTGCRSQCAGTVSGSLLFYFPANTFKRLLGFGLTRLYSCAAELLRGRSHSAGWVWFYPKAGGLIPASAGRVPAVNPALMLAVGAPRRNRVGQTGASFALDFWGNPGRETMSLLKR